jgi:futalosine hydrolase
MSLKKKNPSRKVKIEIIGIIASTNIEVGILINQLAGKEKLSVQKKTFYKGLIKENKPAIICVCGIGKANAAHAATILLEKFKPDIVYSTGVAGAYPSSGMNIGDIAVAEKEVYGDEGLLSKEGFYTIDTILKHAGLRIQNEFQMHIPGKLKDFKNRGTFVTVSSCTGTLKRGKEIEKRFNAICENMEGAAVAHICLINDIPVVEIRGISNIIEDRTGASINKTDIINASKNVQRFLLEKIF